MEVQLTVNNFESEVINSNIPVLVDFGAPWCGPCKMIEPYIEEIAKEFNGKIKVCKLNIEDASQIATQYTVMSIPTLMIFKDGKIMEKRVGLMSKDDLTKLISPYLS